VTGDARPDGHALLELQGLLTEIAALHSEGDADRFAAEARYRWVLQRLWIAAGNEALAYTQATGEPIPADRTWANLHDLRKSPGPFPPARHRRIARPPVHLGPPRLASGHYRAFPAKAAIASEAPVRSRSTKVSLRYADDCCANALRARAPAHTRPRETGET
jgi:hypothetical protein